jgi:hypothetical protein
MRRAPSRLRVAALLGMGAMAVHELRYLLAYGGDSGRALSEQGHAYLPLVTAAGVVLVGLAAGQLMRAVGRARRTGAVEGEAPAFVAAWVLSAVALIVIFALQESLEGLFAAGHPAGVAALTGHGGLVAFPISAAMGALVALGVRGASAAVAAAARSSRGTDAPRAAPVPSPADRLAAPERSPLARHLAGRAPPLLV